MEPSGPQRLPCIGGSSPTQPIEPTENWLLLGGARPEARCRGRGQHLSHSNPNRCQPHSHMGLAASTLVWAGEPGTPRVFASCPAKTFTVQGVATPVCNTLVILPQLHKETEGARRVRLDPILWPDPKAPVPAGTGRCRECPRTGPGLQSVGPHSAQPGLHQQGGALGPPTLGGTPTRAGE